jgi:Ras-related protein Rab-3C
LKKKTGLEFFETSAKDNINVTIVFERLVDLICDRMSKSLDANAAILNNPQTKRLTSQGGGSAPSLLTTAQSSCQQC